MTTSASPSHRTQRRSTTSICSAAATSAGIVDNVGFQIRRNAGSPRRHGGHGEVQVILFLLLRDLRGSVVNQSDRTKRCRQSRGGADYASSARHGGRDRGAATSATKVTD